MQQYTNFSCSVLIKTDMYRINTERTVLWYSVAYITTSPLLGYCVMGALFPGLRDTPCPPHRG